MDAHESSWCRTHGPRPMTYRVKFLEDISSLHDSGDYSQFRNIQSLQENVSGVNTRRANGELKYILENNPEILIENLDKIKEWDSFGNPTTYEFSKKGIPQSGEKDFSINCSDSVFPPLSDIIRIKERLKLSPDFDIVELGCGFGIETKVFHDIVGYNSYTHVDLPDMLKLQSVYLTNFKTPNVIYINPYQDIDNLKTHYDLFISNFAFTELSPDVQEFYFDKIIRKCNMGIILGKMWPKHNRITHNSISKVQIGWIESEFNVKYEANHACGKGGILYFWK